MGEVKPFPSTDQERGAMCALWSLLVVDLLVFGVWIISPSIESWFVLIVLGTAASICLTALAVFSCCNQSCLGFVRTSVYWWVHFALQLVKVIICIIMVIVVFWMIILFEEIMRSEKSEAAQDISVIPLGMLWFMNILAMLALFGFCFAAYKSTVLARHYSNKSTRETLATGADKVQEVGRIPGAPVASTVPNPDDEGAKPTV
uniref:Uncharacterized protein n=1 Tax=Chromera velia CCMP2878 TaxID=1169474 RepID=A0A0G4GGC9_9ALVE|eukprot:Cvel_21774.t1-p1 / transcript=Cvel_21774.t1 / gene=Cvel_21774 / organism=Chromera_velia_CCMP2878 / gene_product=hypothetical protein / transcript_product=hypothetical protein / location=Cvel_scaffold2072:15736-16341(-) / protein_length=202 / sequence_SO=supercontig / SO=protein_coding / is_pseudo=false